jgi:zinc transport system substrate-binding protein
MMKNQTRILRLKTAVALFVFLFGGSRWTPAPAGPRPDDGATGRLHAAAGIPPVAYLAERIGGERVRVSTLLKPGDNPHSFDPTPRQMSMIGGIRVYFSSGFPFESVLVRRLKAGRPDLSVVRTEEGLLESGPPGTDARVHAGHAHNGGDPHIWVAPALLRIQAHRVFDGLAAADPAGEPVFRRNLGRLLLSIDSLDNGIRAALEPYQGRAFLVFHPAFGRFAQAYGLRQLSIESEGKSPTPRQVGECLAEARREGVTVVFTEPRFDPRTAETLARSLGGRAETLDPLAWNVISNLSTVTGRLVASFTERDNAGAKP